MKQTFVIIIAIMLVTSACKKKSPSENCYEFYIYDSVTSNIPVFVKNTLDSEGHCAFTDDQRNNFIRLHSGVDTLYNKHDTLEIGHLTTTWTFF